MSYEPSAMERRARWWLSERRRADVSLERNALTAMYNTAAAMRIIGNALLSAAATKTDEPGTLNGYFLKNLFSNYLLRYIRRFNGYFDLIDGSSLIIVRSNTLCKSRTRYFKHLMESLCCSYSNFLNIFIFLINT